MSKLAKALTAAAGNAAGESLYVEDVFSTYLYTGNGSTQTITNGIDLDGEGGLVWIKQRSASRSHHLADTERGVDSWLNSDLTVEAQAFTTLLSSFNANGFTLETGSSRTNGSGNTYASWTFRKAPKFFDVVTYTGDGTAGRQISHNLGSTPGFFVVKRTDSADNWKCWHTSTGDGVTLELDGNGADTGENWPTGGFTSTYFTVNSGGSYNASGGTYVAYLFASDAGGFGDDDESIIKCGSYTGTGSAVDVSLGFEPQWIMFKRSDSTGDWLIYDVMRGIVTGGSDERLEPNTSDAAASSVACEVTATGFTVTSTGTYMNASGATYIYIAIRRPMKTPESGTEVYNADFYGSTEANNSSPIVRFYAGFPVDFTLFHDRTGGGNHQARARLTGANYLHTNLTDAEIANSSDVFGSNQGVAIESTTASELTRYIRHMFKRATGFFDVVAYTGDGVAGRTVAHNLGVAPEMIIIKQRNASGEDWKTGVNFTATNNQERALNAPDSLVTLDYTSYGVFNGQPTAANITLNSSTAVNASSSTYIAYLFATLAGVSKVFSVTKSSGSNTNVDCGFSAGARFILLKRTDSTGDWYVWDSVRGIVSGNDPYLLLNSTAAEVTTTDYIDPLASGFTIVDGGLANGDYIGLAIA